MVFEDITYKPIFASELEDDSDDDFVETYRRSKQRTPVLLFFL